MIARAKVKAFIACLTKIKKVDEDSRACTDSKE